MRYICLFWLFSIGLLMTTQAQVPARLSKSWKLEEVRPVKSDARFMKVEPSRAWIWIGNQKKTRQTVAALGHQLKRKVYTVAPGDAYIGETEKNLGNLLQWAEKTGVILFFDEADALFGKRTEVADHSNEYANQEVSYLIQRARNCKFCIILKMHKPPAASWKIKPGEIFVF